MRFSIIHSPTFMGDSSECVNQVENSDNCHVVGWECIQSFNRPALCTTYMIAADNSEINARHDPFYEKHNSYCNLDYTQQN